MYNLQFEIPGQRNFETMFWGSSELSNEQIFRRIISTAELNLIDLIDALEWVFTTQNYSTKY
jgi:hypothetical protein